MEDAASAPRPGGRGRRLALVALGVVATGSVVVGTIGWAALARADRLLARASWALGREVMAGGLRVALLGGPSVTVTDVTIAEDPAVGIPTPFVTASRLVMRVDVPALLARRLLVNRVTLDAPVVQLARDPSGRLNVTSLGRNWRTARAGAAVPVHVPRRGFALGKMALRHGTIHYLPRPGEPAFSLREVTLDAREPRFGRPVPVTGSARLDAAGLTMQGIWSEGVLDLSTREPAYRGRLRAARGTAGPVAFTTLAARVTARPAGVELREGPAALLGGRVAGDAALIAAGEDAGIAAHVDGADLDLSALRLPDETTPAGRVELHADLRGPLLGSPGIGAALRGRGSWVVTDGALPIGLGTTVLDELQPIIGESRSERLRERYPDVFTADELRFTRLSGSATLAGGTLQSSDLVVTSASYDCRGTGTLGLDGRLALALEVTVSPELTTELVGRGRTREALLAGRDRLVIPLRVHGSVDRVRVSAAPEFSARVARALIGGDLGDRAGALLERMTRPRKRKGI